MHLINKDEVSIYNIRSLPFIFLSDGSSSRSLQACYGLPSMMYLRVRERNRMAQWGH